MNDAAEEFGAFVAGRHRALVRTAYLLVGDRHEAEDLVQAALLNTYRSWGRIRDRDGGAEAYVRRAMVNQYRSWWRRAWRRREQVTDRVPEQAAESDGSVGERDEVWELVGTLSPRQRAVVVLRFYEDLTTVEIAHALDCSVGTVRGQLSRALATLRARLENPDAARTNTGAAGSGVAVDGEPG